MKEKERIHNGGQRTCSFTDIVSSMCYFAYFVSCYLCCLYGSELNLKEKLNKHTNTNKDKQAHTKKHPIVE